LGTCRLSNGTRIQPTKAGATLAPISLLLPGCLPDIGVERASPDQWLLAPEPEVTMGLTRGDPDYLCFAFRGRGELGYAQTRSKALLAGDTAAVHDQRLAGYKRGVVGGQKENRTGNLLGGANPAKGAIRRTGEVVLPQHAALLGIVG